MGDQDYWAGWRRGRLNRRGLLLGTAAGGAALAAAGLAGCGGKSSTAPAASSSSSQNAAAGTPQKGGTFNTYHNSNMPLDPQKLSAAPQVVVGGVYGRLLRWKTGTYAKTIEDHDIENDHALSMEVPDASTWTFKLRPDVKFHNVAPVNGRPFEAEDVKATFTRFVDPATASPNRTIVSMIDPDQIQTPDAHTITFKLSYPYSPFSRILASGAFGWILPREVLSGAVDPSKQVIGTGPFVADTFTPDVAYVYKRNPDYYNKAMPNVDELKIAIIADTQTQYAQFTGGNLDEQYVLNAFDVDSLKRQNPKAQVFPVDYNSAEPFYFQMGDPTSAFQDIRVRRAFSMAVDRDTINKSIYNNQGGQTVYVPGYMGKWALWTKDLPTNVQQWWKYNPSEAKKMLEAAGATDLVLRVGYISPTTPTNLNELQAVDSYLNTLGVKTTIVPSDYNKDFVDSGHGTRQGYFPKDFVGFYNQSPYEDADFWFYNYFYSKSNSNQEHLNDPKFDAMVDHQRTLTNDDDRLKAVKDILTYMADQCYAPNYTGGAEWIFVQPRVQNYQWSNSLGVATETWAKAWFKQ